MRGRPYGGEGKVGEAFLLRLRRLGVECSAERFSFLGILLGWVLKIKLVNLP